MRSIVNRRQALAGVGAALGLAVAGPLVASADERQDDRRVDDRRVEEHREVEHRFRHERIHRAVLALAEAEHELREAAGDFHGERDEALHAVQVAREHLERIQDRD